MQDKMSIAHASEKMGVSRKTLYQWIDKGWINIYKNEKGKKEVSRKEIIQRAAIGSSEKKQSTEEAENKPQEIITLAQKTEVPKKNTSQELLTREASRVEAERIIKIEDAIKKHRENLLLDGKLIFVDDLYQAFIEILSSLAELQREQIDKWAIQWSFSNDQCRKFHLEQNILIQKCIGKIRQKIGSIGEGTQDSTGNIREERKDTEVLKST